MWQESEPAQIDWDCVTLWLCDAITLWHCDTLTVWHCDCVLLWHFHSVTLTPCQEESELMLTPAACTARLRLHQEQAPAYFTLHTAHYTLHTTHCTLHIAHYTLSIAHYTLSIAHSALHTPQCTLGSAHCTLRMVDAITLHHELENTSFPRPELLRPVAGAKHLCSAQ